MDYLDPLRQSGAGAAAVNRISVLGVMLLGIIA